MLPIYQRTVQPAAEPFTVAELIDFLKASPQDSALITSLGSVAREFVEEQTGRALITQTWTLTCRSWPLERLVLERTPLVSVSAVEYYAEGSSALETLSTDVYRAINAGENSQSWIEIIEGQKWPELEERSDAIRVTFIAGSPAANIKKQLKQAIFLLTKHLYDVGRNPVTTLSVSEVPFTLRDLIASQKVGGWFA